MSKVGTQTVAVRQQQDDMRVLLGGARHQRVQGKDAERRRSEPQVPELFGQPQRLEPALSQETQLPASQWGPDNPDNSNPWSSPAQCSPHTPLLDFTPTNHPRTATPTPLLLSPTATDLGALATHLRSPHTCRPSALGDHGTSHSPIPRDMPFLTSSPARLTPETASTPPQRLSRDNSHHHTPGGTEISSSGSADSQDKPRETRKGKPISPFITYVPQNNGGRGKGRIKQREVRTELREGRDEQRARRDGQCEDNTDPAPQPNQDTTHDTGHSHRTNGNRRSTDTAAADTALPSTYPLTGDGGERESGETYNARGGRQDADSTAKHLSQPATAAHTSRRQQHTTHDLRQPAASARIARQPQHTARVPPTPDTEQRRADNITLLQWNIHGVASKGASLLQYIHTHNTAVIVLQETLANETANMNFRRYQVFQQPHHQGGSRGLMTLVRKDIPATLNTHPPQLGEQVDSLCVTLHLDHATEVDIHNIYCRQRSRLDLMPLLENSHGRLTLLAGDFNAHHPVLEPWGNSTVNQRGQHIVQIMEDFEEVTIHGEPQPTHLAGGRLDLLLTVHGRDINLTINNVPELLSDHWAQEIILPAATRVIATKVEKTRWMTRAANWGVFLEHMNSWYKNYRVPESVQIFANDLTSAIQDAADAAMPRQGKKKFNHGRKRLWYHDGRVKFLTRVSRQLTRKYKHSRSAEDKANLQEWNAHAREQMNTIREEKWLQYTGRLNHSTSMTQVWKTVNRISGRHTPPPAHPDPAQRARELMREYHERAATNSLPADLQERKADLDPMRLEIIKEAMLLPDDTDQPITREELLAARKASSDTAPGEDGITHSMLSAACQVDGDPLLALYNMSLAQGVLPDSWTTANIIPIPKANEPNKYRPISLTSTLCKMLERILLNRLLYKTGNLNTCVNGFVKHRSTANCLANYTANTNGKTAVFLDIEKAFDRAQPLVILEQLTKLGVKGKLLTWVKHYLTGRKARVIFQGEASPHMTLENGTPQGGVMSPALFNVLMNALATLPYPEGTQHIGYADDIVLQTQGKDSVAKMQDSLNLFTDKCTDIGFTVSQTKTKAMAKTRAVPLTKLQIQGNDIEWVATHKYLGVIVARNNTCQAEVRHLRTKCTIRNRILKALSWKGLGATSSVILSIYKALIRSLIDYASPALINISASDAKSLETIQNEALRSVYGAPRWAKTENLRTEAQVSTLAERVKYTTANFMLRTSLQDDHPDHIHTALLHHHEGRRGQGKWVTKAAETLRDLGITWEEVRAAAVPQGAHTRPPWQQRPYTTTIAPLRKSKRDTAREEQRQHGLQQIHEAVKHQTAVYYTDGSVDPQGGQAGAAFVCSMRNSGEAADITPTTPAPTLTAADTTTTTTTRATRGNVATNATPAPAYTISTASIRVTDHSSSTQTELAAIKIALDHAHTSHNHNVQIHTDSMTAIASLNTEHSDNIHLTHAIHTTATAIRRQGRSINISWIPSHAGITGNERADSLAKQGAQDPVVSCAVPRTLTQLQRKMKHQAERRRHQQESEARHNDSASARWLAAVTDAPAQHPRTPESRRCEVVRSRIRLGYPYAWQLGIATAEDRRRCRLCHEEDAHTLEHYLRDCPRVNPLRVQCPVPDPTLTDLAKHFLTVLTKTLNIHPKFCDTAP